MLFRPALPCIVLGMMTYTSMSLADDGGSTNQWKNTTNASLVALRADEKTYSILAPGQGLEGVGADVSVAGRFKIDEWLFPIKITPFFSATKISK